MPRHTQTEETAYQTLRRYARQVALQMLYQEDFRQEIDVDAGDLFLHGRLSFGAVFPPPSSDEDAESPDAADQDDLAEALQTQLRAMARERAEAIEGMPIESEEKALAMAHDDISHFIDQHGLEFARRLLHGVRNHREAIDSQLAAAATNWSVHRMAATDRNVLRLGAYELLMTDTPPRVAINEALELAKRFGAAQSSQFVNGILDRLLQNKGDALPDAPPQ